MAKVPTLIPKLTQLFSQRISCLRKLTLCYHTNSCIINETQKYSRFLQLHGASIKRTTSTEQTRIPGEAKARAKAYLHEMGFDIIRIEDKRPTTLKGNLNKIQNNIQFFRQLDLDDKAIKSIVSRQPGLLSVSIDHLQDHVDILHKYNLTVEQIGQVLIRAPRFFSVPMRTIQGNVNYIKNLEVTKRKIHIILLHYPTTFSRKINGIELVCTQILDILKAHFTMDEEVSRKMLRSMVMVCPKVFIRSPGEIARNIQYLESLGFTGKALYMMIRICPESLRVYPSYIQRKFDFIQQLFSLDNMETVRLIRKFPRFINFQPKLLQAKVDAFQALGFTLEQIRHQPRVFSFSLTTFNRRYKALKEAGYEFKTMRLLTLSEAQIENEIKRLKISKSSSNY